MARVARRRSLRRTAYLDDANHDPKPFLWTVYPDKIIAAVSRGRQALESIHWDISVTARLLVWVEIGRCGSNLCRSARGSLLLRRIPEQPGRYEPQRGEESG
jgi:hypothetical protein